MELTSKVEEHQRMLREQEDAFNKLMEEYKQSEGLFHEFKNNLQVTERRLEEMEEESRVHLESKAHIIADFETMVEDLKRDLEVKGDELSTLVEEVRNIEVKLRLSNQKLRVTEQLLSEKEESYKRAEERFQQENRALEGQVAVLSEVITSNNESHVRMITDISETVNNTLAGLESTVGKFKEDSINFKNRISEIAGEVQVARNWVKMAKSEKEQLKSEASNLVEQLKYKKRKEEDEKESLIKAVSQLEKKVGELEKMMNLKDEGILDLGEQKREAIRQLCVWIDYHRERCDYLREMLAKMNIRSQRT